MRFVSRFFALLFVAVSSLAIVNGFVSASHAQESVTTVDDDNPIVTVPPITGTTIRDDVATIVATTTVATTQPASRSTARTAAPTTAVTPTTIAAEPSASAATGAAETNIASSSAVTTSTVSQVSVAGVQVERQGGSTDGGGSAMLFAIVLAVIGAIAFAASYLLRRSRQV
jgi:cobalamin biosynthesis Mg chelatase CobN